MIFLGERSSNHGFTHEKLVETPEGGTYPRIKCVHGFDPHNLSVQTDAEKCNYMTGMINWNADAQGVRIFWGSKELTSTCDIGHCPPESFLGRHNGELAWGSAALTVVVVLCTIFYATRDSHG